jgi:DNA helicase-2/ATP-dependent DNA helicase PcrA
VENIADYFGQRGVPFRQTKPAAAAPKPTPVKKAGSTVNHPKYGRGTIVRREGEGDDAKITVMFPGHGMKKLIARFARIE